MLKAWMEKGQGGRSDQIDSFFEGAGINCGRDGDFDYVSMEAPVASGKAASKKRK